MTKIDFETVVLRQDEGIASLTLNRPESLNAMNLSACVDIQAALRALLASPHVRALVITGAGRGFCAGADQRGLPEAPLPNDSAQMLRDYFIPTFALLASFPVPKLASVNGVAAGAGLSLALGCDLVIAARSAYFVAAFANQALVPDTGTSWWLPRAIGLPRANAMLLLNERIAADEAARIGLIHRSVDDSALEAETAILARRLAEGPTVALALTSRLTRAAATNSLADQFEEELRLQAEARATADRHEARRAFAEKRKPGFSGR